MRTVTQPEYELFNQFVDWFKVKTDTDLSSDVMDFFKSEIGVSDTATVVDIICQKLGVDKDMLTSKCRKRELVECRRIIARILVDRGETRKSVGITLGGRDHSTIVELLGGHQWLMSYNNEYRAKYISAVGLIITKEPQRVII